MQDEEEEVSVPCIHELDRNVRLLPVCSASDGIVVDVYCVHCGASTGVLILASDIEWDD